MRPAQGLWSADGKYFVTYRYDQRSLKPQYYWHAVTAEGYGRRPEVIEQLAPYPGDGNASAHLLLIDVEAGTARPIPGAAIQTFYDPITAGLVQWSPNGRFCYFLQEGPGLRWVTLNRLDVGSMMVSELYRQESSTYLALSG